MTRPAAMARAHGITKETGKPAVLLFRCVFPAECSIHNCGLYHDYEPASAWAKVPTGWTVEAFVSVTGLVRKVEAPATASEEGR